MTNDQRISAVPERPQRRDQLKQKTDRFPKTSGVYLMRNAARDIIYVGKAANLVARVRSYFQSHLAPKTQSLMAEVADISFRRTDSELDALLLEARLVRELQPKYNIQLTDDKSFPLIAITEEDYPRVFITRERGKKGVRYFGPFISAVDLRSAYRTLQRIFKFRNCYARQAGLSGKPAWPRHCLLKHINLCLAPCVDRITPAEYQANIQSLVDFLNGDKASLKKRIEALMKDASRRLDYESAANYRNQLRTLENISQIGKMGSAYEEPLLSQTPGEKIKLIQEKLGLPQAHQRSPVTRSSSKASYCEVIPSGGASTAQGQAHQRSPGASTAQGQAHQRSPGASTAQGQAHQRSPGASTAQGQPPMRIEGIDISDIKGTQAVGSVVVFIDGQPANQLYRRFKIRETPEGRADDYSRIREVLRRRVTKLSADNTKVDLFLIDGGKGHVKAATSVLNSLSADSLDRIGHPALAGLAKGHTTGIEIIYLLRNNQIVRFRMDHRLRLLAYVRDEAHRFAQKYHHLRRKMEAFNKPGSQ